VILLHMFTYANTGLSKVNTLSWSRNSLH